MAQQHRKPVSRQPVSGEAAHGEKGFKRHGPEPPENDSGPSPSVDEMDRFSGVPIRNVEGDEQVD